MDGIGNALQGQPAYVVLLVVLIGAVAYVVSRVWRKNADDGGGQAGLRAVDSAAEYLTEKALEERGYRKDAEKERDAAQRTRDETLADLARTRADLVAAQAAAEDCDRRAQEAAAEAVTEERRRRGEG